MLVRATSAGYSIGVLRISPGRLSWDLEPCSRLGGARDLESPASLCCGAHFFYPQAPHPPMRFEETKKFEGDPSEVWKRASTIGDIPKYWHGTRTLEVVGEDGGVAHAKIKFAFGGSGEADISKDEEKRVLTIAYTSGPFTGKQTVGVEGGQVVAAWDVEFKGVFRIASRWNEGHFKSGTVHALERLTGQESPA